MTDRCTQRAHDRTARDARVLAGRRIVVANWRAPDHAEAGGAERYAWESTLALRDAGAEVTYLTGREHGRPREERRDGIRVVRRGGRLTIYPAVLAWLARHRRHVDLVLDTENGIPFFAPLAVGSRRVLLVMHHVHLAQFDAHFPPPVAAVGKWLERTLMPAVYRRAHTVAVSPSTELAMRDQLRWRGRIDIVRNGTAPPRPVERTPPPPARLVVLGRLAVHKRVGSVVRACAALVGAGVALRLDIVGRGPEEAAVRAEIERCGLVGHATVHGYLDDARRDAVLAQAHLQVCASDGEGWGQVVLDAAGWGVPTVAYDVPGLRDAVLDGVTGWLCAPDGDLAAAVGAALERLADPATARAMAQACRERAAGHPWATMHEQTVLAVARRLDAG